MQWHVDSPGWKHQLTGLWGLVHNEARAERLMTGCQHLKSLQQGWLVEVSPQLEDEWLGVVLDAGGRHLNGYHLLLVQRAWHTLNGSLPLCVWGLWNGLLQKHMHMWRSA